MATQSSREVLLDEVLEQIAAAHEDPVGLRDWLVAFAGDDERRQTVADAVRITVRRLAPDDAPPSDKVERELWQTLAGVVDSFYGSGFEPLGRLDFIGDELLELLLRESYAQLPERPDAGSRMTGQAGDALARLAVSRQLREAVGDAFGLVVAPTYNAVYQYDPPGSHVQTHVDRRDYEIVVHLILEHELPAGLSGGSALVVHPPGDSEPARLRPAPGEAVALRGRGTIHSWERLAEGERRTLTAFGFERRAG